MTTEGITMEFLEELERDRQQAQQLATDASVRRNDAVLVLLDSGIRPVEVARRLGLTAGRVSQIATAARQAREREQALVA